MQQKTYNMISAITTGVMAIATGLVVYFDPPYCAAIASSIDAIGGTVMIVCANFLKK